MPNVLTSFISRLRTSPRGLVLPVVIGGLVSISWSFPQTCACIPQARQQIRQIRALNRLHQRIYPQKGIISTSLTQLNRGLERPEKLPSESNFYRLSVRMTKKAVLNYGKTKLINPHQGNTGTRTSMVTTKTSQLPQIFSIVTRLGSDNRDREK